MDAVHTFAQAQGIFPDWVKHEEWSHMSDIEILEEMKAQVGSCESIFLVPWASQWARGGPFCIAQTELRDFIQAFKSEIGEPFFSGDTWILCPKLNRILLLQHEWIFAQVDLKGIA